MGHAFQVWPLLLYAMADHPGTYRSSASSPGTITVAPASVWQFGYECSSRTLAFEHLVPT